MAFPFIVYYFKVLLTKLGGLPSQLVLAWNILVRIVSESFDL